MYGSLLVLVYVRSACAKILHWRERERESNLVIHDAIFRSTTVGDFVSSCLLSTVGERRKRGWPGVTTCTSSTYTAL